MTNHIETIKNLLPSERQILDQIGAGNKSPIAPPHIISDLLGKTLIRRLPDKILGGGIPVRVERYEMPVDAHMAWCEVCSEELGDEE